MFSLGLIKSQDGQDGLETQFQTSQSRGNEEGLGFNLELKIKCLGFGPPYVAVDGLMGAEVVARSGNKSKPISICVRKWPNNSGRRKSTITITISSQNEMTVTQNIYM